MNIIFYNSSAFLTAIPIKNSNIVVLIPIMSICILEIFSTSKIVVNTMPPKVSFETSKKYSDTTFNTF